jgi:hypothetical protein
VTKGLWLRIQYKLTVDFTVDIGNKKEKMTKRKTQPITPVRIFFITIPPFRLEYLYVVYHIPYSSPNPAELAMLGIPERGLLRMIMAASTVPERLPHGGAGDGVD